MAALRVVSLSLAFVLAGCIQVPDGNVTVGETPAADGSVPGGDGSAANAGSAASGGSGPPGPSGSATSGTGGTDAPAASSSQGTGVTFDVPRSIHEASWLCQTAVVVDDLTDGGTDGQQCKVTLSFTDSRVTVTSTGIPNHDYESGGGCCAKTRSLTNSFPLKPELAKAVTYAPVRGSIATAVNGVEIYGPEDADDADVVIVTYSSPTAQPRLELCDAHSTPNSQGGAFHYHADGNCIHWHAPSGQSWADYDFGKVDATQHSKIIAWAPDGFPIYGTYGYAANSTAVKEITSSYRLKAGATGSSGIADQEYVAGLGDLDECNGRTSKTPEFPDGIYHYYSTRKNGEGGFGFPYFPLCYKGVVSSSGGGMPGAGGTSGSMSGSMSGTMSGPPPSGSVSGSMSGSMSGGPPPGGSSSTSGSCPPPPPPGSSPTGPPPSGCPPPPPPP